MLEKCRCAFGYISLRFPIKDVNAIVSAWSADPVVGADTDPDVMGKLVANGKKGMFVNWLMMIQTLSIESSAAK